MCLFSVSHLLSLSTTVSLSLSLITSLSHGGLFWPGSWVWRGGETGEVEIIVVWWRFLGFLGLDWCVMIGGMFKLFAAWFPLNKCRQVKLYLPWKCEYELVMERMKFWVLLKPSCEI